MARPANDFIPDSVPALEERYEAWCDLGRQAFELGDAEEALWCLRRAIELCSDDPDTWELLGRCFEAIGEETRARRCYTVASRQLLRSGRAALARSGFADAGD